MTISTSSRHEGGEYTERTTQTAETRVPLLIPSFVMILAIWLATGTMAPYAGTLDRPLTLQPCRYLANVDHAHFLATFALLDRHRAAEWDFSVVLRRILYPIVAYPLMKLFAVATADSTTGFLLGGVLTTILIQIATLGIFVIFGHENRIP